MSKRLLFIIGVLSFCITAGVYWYYLSEPSTLPKQEELKNRINRVHPDTEVVSIQDTILLDSRHLYVPFISKNNDYGSSFWVWKKRMWELEAINDVGQPILWKIDSKDPSSYRIVWNIHPEDQFHAAEFYLSRDRGYEITNGIEFYYPKVQLIKEFTLSEKSYGIKKLPKNWASIIQSTNNIHNPDRMSILDGYNAEHSLLLAWKPVFDKKNGDDIFSKRSISGGGFSNGGDYDIISLVEEHQLENQQ